MGIGLKEMQTIKKAACQAGRYAVWLPAVSIMILIFCFSSQEAKESSALSEGVSQRMVYLYDEIQAGMFGGEHLGEARCMAYAKAIETFVRKAAHMTEYGILAMSITFAMGVGKNSLYQKRRWSSKRLVIYSWLFTSAYAATDEFHQLFVPGRSGEGRDVLIDAVGALAGSLFMYLLLKVSAEKRAE